MKNILTLGLGTVAFASIVVVACSDDSSPTAGGLDAGTGAIDGLDAQSSPADAAEVLSDGATDEDAGDAGDDAGVTLPKITSTTKLTTTVDRTGQEFGAPTPDTIDDAAVTATIEGAFDALLWVSTDADGNAAEDSHEWDTVILTEPLPSLGSGYDIGAQTWTIAVADGTTLLNDATGHVSLPAGTRVLTLSVAATAKMTAGQHFRIYARLGTSWVAGPIFVW